MTTTGIVLSGGGARGIAHLGVLEALEETGVRIDAIAGTSTGAVVAALYAAGHRPRQIKEMLKENSYFGISRLRFNKAGLFKIEGLKELLQQHVPFDRFEDLPIRTYVAATDLVQRRSVIFGEGPLLEPVMASACVPVIFEPVRFMDGEWVDGGILNNFPVEALENNCTRIIGSHVNRQGDQLPDTIALRKMHILEKCFHMAIANTVYEKAPKCSLFLDPPELSPFGLFEVQKADEIFGIGYRNAMRHRSALEAFAADVNHCLS